jgi:hypothetical protein
MAALAGSAAMTTQATGGAELVAPFVGIGELSDTARWLKD